MKKLLISIFLLFPLIYILSENPAFKVSEAVGSIDVSINNENWKNVTVNDSISGSIEIFTGFHSHITLKLNENSFITINQLTHIKIDNISITDKGINTTVYLLNGHLLASSKNEKNYSTKILVNLEKGNALFDKSSGEIFYTPEKGALIKSISGWVKIGAKMIKTYYITKNEVCGILPGGKLIESDYYLRRQINGKPADLTESNDIESYYERFFNNYTAPRRSNDYGTAKRP